MLLSTIGQLRLKSHQIIAHTKEYTTVLKQFFTFAVGTFLMRGITIIFAPITMSILSPADYGLLSLANSFVSIATVLLGMGLRQALSLEYFHAEHKGRIAIINDIITIYTLVSIPLLLICLCNLTRINQYIFIGQASTTLLLICLFICFIYFFVELFYQILQYQQKVWHLTKIQAAMTIMSISLNLFFLCKLRLGALSIMLGQAITMGCIALYALHAYSNKSCINQLNWRQSARNTTNYIKLGLPFMPSVLFAWILSSANRWVLAHTATMHAVGIYAVADTLGQLANMVIYYAIAGSYMPYLLNKFAQNKDNLAAVEAENKKVMKACLIACFALLALSALIFQPLFYWLIPAKFHEAISYMWLILIGSIFLLGTCFCNCLIQYHKKSLFLGLSPCLPALLNVGLCYALVPLIGLPGCVFASILSYTSYFLIALAYNCRLANSYK